MSMRLSQSFYASSALFVARALLGKQLVRLEQGRRLAGIISETEAYSGENDLGCHCKHGRTPRTRVMYGPPGHAYIYFTYGMHWCLNFVVEPEHFPAAVLIRAIQPTQGLAAMAERRVGVPREHLTDGPAKLCQALNIDGTLNGSDLCSQGAVIWVESVEARPEITDDRVLVGPRVGLKNVPEPWKSIPWRFRLRPDATNLASQG